MTILQPVLVPCTGTLADLHVSVDPSTPERLHIYWGTALLQVIPRDKNSVLFKVSVGLLLNLKFRIGAVAKAFGVSEKSLRVWRDALKNGDWLSLGGDLDHLPTNRKLRRDVERYIRASYYQACKDNGGRMPYGFRKQLCGRVAGIWPDQEVCEETLRQLFRNEDALVNSANEMTAGDEDQGPMNKVDEAVDPAPGSPKAPSIRSDIERLSSHQDSDENRRLSSDFSEKLRSKDEENRKLVCDSSPSVGQESYSFESEVKDNRLIIEKDEIGDVDLINSGRPSFADDNNRKLSPGFSGDLKSDDEKKKELAGDSSEQLSPTHDPLRTESALPGNCQARSPPNRPCFPLLSGEQPRNSFISQHAGILLLAPEFDEAFDHLPAILRQTAAQILIGCVNQEQGKLIDYDGLGRIAGKVIRDLERQRTLLDLLAEQGMEMLVYEGNIRLLKLRSTDELILYCDTHHSEYTGCERIVLGWSGLQKKVLRGIMMEFFHTAQGEPCMIGHYDNFYDGRQRFFLLRERFVERLLPWTGHFVWVHDRGYWGYHFLRQVVECGDIFIQWEKNYKQDGWDQPCQHDGHFSITLQGNSSRDQRKQVKVDWKEQEWDKFANGRRFIVHIKHSSGQSSEVAIVTNHPTMPAEKVIRLMLSRFLQENDFSYLNRHVGINELTARKFDRYQEIAHELQDRDVDSRAYKKTKKLKLALQEKLKDCLFKLDGLAPISLATLEKQRTRLRQKAERLAEQLSRLVPATVTDNLLARLSGTVCKLKEKLRRNSDQRVVDEERRAEKAKRDQLHQQIEQVNSKLAQISRTESRLLMFFEEKYMRPNMDRKALVDAVRITSRNVFCRALQSFRPYYDNYRDDHVVLRALTHAAGIIVPHADRIDVYLLPRLERQTKQWDRIALFLRDREKRIKQHFGTTVRFILRQSFARILHAVNRLRAQENSLSE